MMNSPKKRKKIVCSTKKKKNSINFPLRVVSIISFLDFFSASPEWQVVCLAMFQYSKLDYDGAAEYKNQHCSRIG